METMRCIWCEKETTTDKNLKSENIKFANKEHIFPESVGGKKILTVGKVCKDCNSRLGNNVDRYLKTENFAFMLLYQEASYKNGKPIGKDRGKIDYLRKEAEIHKLDGYGGGMTVQRDSECFNLIKLINMASGTAGDLIYNEKFSKALHKCALNILIDEQSYGYVKKNHQDLIYFINYGDNYKSWSYGICYFNFLLEFNLFEPFCIQQFDNSNGVLAVVLIFPCAICVIGVKPNIVNGDLLKLAGDHPNNVENWQNHGFNYIDYYQSSFNHPEKSFGEKLKFNLIEK